MIVGEIGNHYGALHVEETSNGIYQWGIEDYSGIDYEEIPKYLYDALIKFEKNKNKEKK